MARKDDNLTRYLSDCVRYGYYTNEELKRVSESPILKHETYSREYTIEANVRNARYQMQRESIKGNVYVVPHYACRPQHIQYQDMVYSKKLFDEKIAYPNNPDGIGCVNCRHEVVEHYDGIEEQYDSTFRNTEELIQQYNDEQKMRRYENEIRKLKLAGEGNDEQLRRGYARLMEHSRATNTPIQINRTWTINASRYNVSMPNKRLDMMNLLPRYTNESFDYGFVKTTARMKGKRASYFIDGIDISDCNFFPESVRTAYTGRAYGIGKDMSEEAFKSSMETIIHTSQSEGITLMWADKTTTNVLNATGCFFIPEATAVDDVNPFEIYEDITNHEVPREKLTPTSYGIYVDDDGVWRFFYADKLPDSDHIYDLSREPNRSKVTSKVMDTSIKHNWDDVTQDRFDVERDACWKSFGKPSGMGYYDKALFNSDDIENLSAEIKKNGATSNATRVDEIDEAIHKHKLSQDMKMYYFVDNNDFARIMAETDLTTDERINLGYTRGYTIKTSRSCQRLLNDCDAIVEIRVPKGTHAYVRGNKSGELILPRGMRMKMVSFDIDFNTNKSMLIFEIEEETSTNLKKANEFLKLMNKMDNKGIYCKPVTKMNEILTDEQIIKKIGGADNTDGSCASLSLAYIGNHHGYDVLDFRGDIKKKLGSRYTFATEGAEEVCCKYGKGYNPFSYHTPHKQFDVMIDDIEEGKMYAMGFGRHMAIVRKTNGLLEYLELQNFSEYNGWKNINNSDYYLTAKSDKAKQWSLFKKRFGVRDNELYSGFICDIENINTDDFVELLGYINTNEREQKKNGKGGGIK